MNTRQILGLLLILSPFIGLFTFIVNTLGWGAAISIYGAVSILILVVITGLYLLNKD